MTDPDEWIYVTTRQAAKEAGVPESTIRTWASRGLLFKIGTLGRTALYDLTEVLTCEMETRKWVEAHGGGQRGKATRRDHAHASDSRSGTV